MKKLHLKPMRPGGYYPSQLGLDDEYRDLRRVSVALLDELVKVGTELLRRYIAQLPQAEQEIDAKFFSLQYGCFFGAGATAAVLEEFKPNEGRDIFFDVMMEACVTAINGISMLRALDGNA